MKFLKNLNQKNIHLTRLDAIKRLGHNTPIDALGIAFVDLSNQVRVNKFNQNPEKIMKKILLILTTLTFLNFAHADENTPVNFHRDQRLGQFNMSFKLVSNGTVIQDGGKICFVTDRTKDDPATGKLDPGCSSKKLQDSATDLEYLISCTNRPDTNLHWIRLSESEFSLLTKSSQTEMTSTYKYVGTQCDADAIRK